MQFTCAPEPDHAPKKFSVGSNAARTCPSVRTFALQSGAAVRVTSLRHPVSDVPPFSAGARDPLVRLRVGLDKKELLVLAQCAAKSSLHCQRSMGRGVRLPAVGDFAVSPANPR